MHDGWETRRRRGGDEDSHDWLVVRLGLPGTPRSVLVDTSHFKGNAPGSVSVDAGDGTGWTEIIARRPVEPHRQHLLEASAPVAATQVRLNLYPDGGVARFRVFGSPDPAARRGMRLAYLNSLFPSEADRFFRTVCAADRFVGAMTAGRPYVGTVAVLEAAHATLDRLGPDDWRQAFAAHPRIGERTRSPFAAGEQRGATGAPPEVLEGLRQGNAEYEARFAMPFIVRAAGRSGEEMLAMLRERLGHDDETELAVAAGEQRRIAELRLRRMLCMEPDE